eukprot:scaffold2.g6965.t1
MLHEIPVGHLLAPPDGPRQRRRPRPWWQAAASEPGPSAESAPANATSRPAAAGRRVKHEGREQQGGQGTSTQPAASEPMAAVPGTAGTAALTSPALNAAALGTAAFIAAKASDAGVVPAMSTGNGDKQPAEGAGEEASPPSSPSAAAASGGPNAVAAAAQEAADLWAALRAAAASPEDTAAGLELRLATRYFQALFLTKLSDRQRAMHAWRLGELLPLAGGLESEGGGGGGRGGCLVELRAFLSDAVAGAGLA